MKGGITMAKQTSKSSTNKIRPALTPEARENQLIAMTMDRVEEQLMNGTASSQILTHFLKLATVKANLEMEKLKHETKLLEAKTESLQSAKRMEELYDKAINAMRDYSGQGNVDVEDE